jgi:hypothetical protein
MNIPRLNFGHPSFEAVLPFADDPQREPACASGDIADIQTGDIADSWVVLVLR